MAAPPRTAAGYRSFSQQDLERVVVTKTCQHLGFTLKDIRSLAGLHDRLTFGAGGCAEEASRLGIAATAQQRLRQIDEKLRLLGENAGAPAGTFRRGSECRVALPCYTAAKSLLTRYVGTGWKIGPCA